MSKHTPGPWFIDLDELGEETNIYASHLRPGSRASICEMNMEKMTWSDEQSLANSRLISAAPDLLEALEALLPIAIEGNDYIPISGLTEIQLARKAIARAKGESQ